MSSNRQKESARAGRRAPQFDATPQQTLQPASPASEDANAANTLDATLLQSMMDSLRSDIFEKIDGLSTSLRSEIASVRQELKNSIEPLQRTVDAHEVTVHELERAATDYDARLIELEATVGMLTKKAARLENKCEDLEGRSRRNNIRVVGVPEGVEGPRPTDFIAQLLQDLLGLNEKPLLDRAHRTLREQPSGGNPPRPFVARIHFFHVRNLILQRAGEASPLLYKGKRVSVFPDYTSSVAKKRAAFTTVKRNLRSCPDVKFGLLYPAVLKVTMPDGSSHRFEDPIAATDFINKNCK